MKKKVLVALSGGVDSAVTALLLKKKGFEVSAVTMYFKPGEKWSGEKKYENFPYIKRAQNVCKKLGIKLYILNFSSAFKKYVLKNFLNEYRKGRTPNPCVVCNSRLKFAYLLKWARLKKFDFLATGHYVRVVKRKKQYFLKIAKDKIKDQSYFLYGIKKESLKNLIFPLGNLTKDEVKEIALKNSLFTQGFKESQDICFIPEGQKNEFLSKNFKNLKKGLIIFKNGRVLGKHKGIVFYTIGQRTGLGISFGRPLYVIKIDYKNNLIIVGEKQDLFRQGLIAKNLNWFSKKIPQKAFAKIRYSHIPAFCHIIREGNIGKKIKVIFTKAQPAITQGQSVVFYNKEGIVLGGGVIDEVFL